MIVRNLTTGEEERASGPNDVAFLMDRTFGGDSLREYAAQGRTIARAQRNGIVVRVYEDDGRPARGMDLTWVQVPNHGSFGWIAVETVEAPPRKLNLTWNPTPDVRAYSTAEEMEEVKEMIRSHLTGFGSLP